MSQKLQIGAESQPGTPVPATLILGGVGRLQDGSEFQFRPVNNGRLARSLKGSRTGRVSSLNYEADATFEELDIVLGAGIANVDNGVQDGSGSGYIRLYPMPTSANTPVQSYTVQDVMTEGFNETAPYAYVESFTLSGEADGKLKIVANWKTAKVIKLESGNVSVAVLPSDTEEILFNCGGFWVNDSGESIGTNQISDKLISFSLSVPTGLRPVITQDCAEGFARLARNKDAISPTLEYVIDGDGDTASNERTKKSESAIRLIRIEFDGLPLSTAGDVYDKKKLRIDLAGIYTALEADEEDGAGICKATLAIGESEADNLNLSLMTVNERAARLI